MVRAVRGRRALARWPRQLRDAHCRAERRLRGGPTRKTVVTCIGDCELLYMLDLYSSYANFSLSCRRAGLPEQTLGVHMIENTLTCVRHEDWHLRDATVCQHNVCQFKLVECNIEYLASMRFFL